MSSLVTARPARERSVFINCPFDQPYQPLLRAACFTILACGWVPRCALDFSDSGEVRFTKIVDLIAACDFSLHDISRVEAPEGLPRFNMPLELGADLGLRLAGSKTQRGRKTRIVDAVAHRYDKTLSAISGNDLEIHDNNPSLMILRVRGLVEHTPRWGLTARREGAPRGLQSLPDNRSRHCRDPPPRLARRDAASRLHTRGRAGLAIDRASVWPSGGGDDSDGERRSSTKVASSVMMFDRWLEPPQVRHADTL